MTRKGAMLFPEPEEMLTMAPFFLAFMYFSTARVIQMVE